MPVGVLDQHQDSEGANFGFGQLAGVVYRGQCFTPALAGALGTVGFSRVKTSNKDIKVYIDTASANIPDHAVGSELYSFVIPQASIIDGYAEYDLPTPFPLTTGVQYCFYLAPWDSGTNAYSDDYADCHGVASGSLEITGTPGFFNENLTFHYSTYMTPTAKYGSMLSMFQ